MPWCAQQHPRPPRVLRRDHVDLAQHAQRPQRDVLEIPDRRRDHVEDAAGDVSHEPVGAGAAAAATPQLLARARSAGGTSRSAARMERGRGAKAAAPAPPAHRPTLAPEDPASASTVLSSQPNWITRNVVAADSTPTTPRSAAGKATGASPGSG